MRDFLPYTWKRIHENFHVYVIFYVTYVICLRYVKVEITSYCNQTWSFCAVLILCSASVKPFCCGIW